MPWTMTNSERRAEKALNKLFRHRYGRKKPKRHTSRPTKWYPGKYNGSRQTVEYYNWRKAVLKRDNYTCVQCREVGGKLHAHHILGHTKNPDLQTDIDNGVTLCIGCHEDLHGFVIGSKVG